MIDINLPVRINFSTLKELEQILNFLEDNTSFIWASGHRPTRYRPNSKSGHLHITNNGLITYSSSLYEIDVITLYELTMRNIDISSDELSDFLEG